jgi:hypothetical protein
LTHQVLALKVAEKWGWDIVPIWIEKFVLTVFAASFFGLVILNGLKMDWIQRTGLGVGIVGFSIFLGQTVHSSKKAKVDTEDSQQSEQEKPRVQQSSQGANSPVTNITGDNNTVNNTVIVGDPKDKARFETIVKLLKDLQKDRLEPDKLLARYPLGYVIFDVTYSNSVFPYEARKDLLDKWDFDWSTVQLTEGGLAGMHDPDAVSITFPTMHQKNGPGYIKGSKIGATKKIGPFPSSNVIIVSDGKMAMKAEILAIRDSGIIFLIGFTRQP